MKNKKILLMLFALFMGILFLSCKKEESDPPDMTPDWLNNDYIGTLYVNYTNTYPEWDVNTQVEAEIVKELGTIDFQENTLNYSGETLVSEDSKIIRSGSWRIKPTGEMVGDLEHPTINVDAHITVLNDIQQIYAKDDSGNWVMVSEADFSNQTPDSQLVFNLDDAVLTGSDCGISTPTGSIIWTLTLSIVP